MTTVKATCPYCGHITLAPTEITLHAPPPPSTPWYTFRCPTCTTPIHRPACPDTIRLLAEAGITPDWAPDEAFETHTGPPLTLDDLLDLHQQLDTIPTATEVDPVTAARIRTACHTISSLWATAEQPPRTIETQTRTAYGPRLPGSSEALTIRVTTTRDLTHLTWSLRTRLNLTTVVDGSNVPAMTRLIGIHADSLTILDPTAVHTLELHARHLTELIRQTRPSRIRVADCPRCPTGVLYASLRPEDPDRLGDVVACDNTDQVDGVDEDGRACRVPACGASWSSFEWRACWREVRQVHGRSGRRAPRATRWEAAAAVRFLAALRDRPAGQGGPAGALGVPAPAGGSGVNAAP